MATDTASWEPFDERDQYGKPSYGDVTTFAFCRLVRKHKLVRDAQGDLVVSTAQLWVFEETAPAIGPEDQITLSDGTTPPIITTERFQDEVGASHTKVYFR